MDAHQRHHCWKWGEIYKDSSTIHSTICLSTATKSLFDWLLRAEIGCCNAHFPIDAHARCKYVCRKNAQHMQSHRLNNALANRLHKSCHALPNRYLVRPTSGGPTLKT
jgi:hypothetical protein